VVVVDSYSLDDAFAMDEEIVDDDVLDVDASFLRFQLYSIMIFIRFNIFFILFYFNFTITFFF
jgi:hypothetical protein